MKRFLSLLLLLFILNTLSSQTIDNRTGISIFHLVDKNTFPLTWTSKEIAATGVSLDSMELERSLNIIINALNKYPAEIITQNLKEIYILKSIEFYGQEFGGTNSKDALYIANDGVLLGYSDFYIEKTFHHEFSSILLRNFSSNLKTQKWIKNNKIEYGNGGVQALKDSTYNQEFSASLHANGFLHQYATSDFENDFNSFAENLFHPSENFYETLGDYPLLSDKFDLILKFYASLHNSFTRKYFFEINNENIHNME